MRSSNDDFKNYYRDALINVLSIWRRMSSSIEVTPRTSHQDKNLLVRRCSGKIFLQFGQLKSRACIHIGEKTRVCHLRNKRFFHANAHRIHYTVHIGIHIYTYMKFVCDDSFVHGILKDTNASVSPTKCTENEKITIRLSLRKHTCKHRSVKTRL